MTKTLLYRLFRIGKIPDQFNAQIQSEGILLQDEGIPGSVTYSSFHRPGRYDSWRRQWYTASLAITETRFLALAYSRPAIDVPFADERFRSLEFSLEKNDRLRVAFDASLFHADWSGKIDYRFGTSQAQAFLDLLKARSA